MRCGSCLQGCATNAGKSTMFKTVFGLLPVRSGGIRFEGQRIDGRVETEQHDTATVRIAVRCVVDPVVAVNDVAMVFFFLS